MAAKSRPTSREDEKGAQGGAHRPHPRRGYEGLRSRTSSTGRMSDARPSMPISRTRDDLLMAILADLEMPGLDPAAWKPDDEAFGWTLALFEHFGSGRGCSRRSRVARAERWRVRERRSGSRSLPEASPAPVARRLDAFQIGDRHPLPSRDVLGFMEWWMREENEHLPAAEVDHAFRSLVLPGERRARAGTGCPAPCRRGPTPDRPLRPQP